MNRLGGAASVGWRDESDNANPSNLRNIKQEPELSVGSLLKFSIFPFSQTILKLV